jgi:penicillin-binding protein 2
MVMLGSTQKPLSVLVGLNEGLFTTTSTYLDSGTFTFGKKGSEVPIQNALNHAYGNLDPAHAIGKSSNPFMAAMVGDRMYRKYSGLEGVDKWDEYMKAFGLGVKTGSGLPSENAGIIEYYHEAESASTQSALIRPAGSLHGPSACAVYGYAGEPRQADEAAVRREDRGFRRAHGSDDAAEGAQYG